MEISVNPACKDNHHFKLAVLEKTIACPTETSLYLSDPRLLLALLLLSFAALVDALVLQRRSHEPSLFKLRRQVWIKPKQDKL